MNSQQKMESIGEEDAEIRYRSFLQSMTTVESLLAEENTPEELEKIREELDTIYNMGEEAYCSLLGNSRHVPDNYADLQWIISERAKDSLLTEDVIYNIVMDARNQCGEVDARVLWAEALPQIEREEQMQSIRTGPQTSTADWK